MTINGLPVLFVLGLMAGWALGSIALALQLRRGSE